MLDYAAYRQAARRNYFEQDPVFGELLSDRLRGPWRDWTLARSAAVGEAAATRWADLAATANEQPPRLRPMNPWGERIDTVEVHPAYDQLAREAYEAGLVWPRFDTATHGVKAPWMVVLGLGYLFGQAEQGLFCPVCLTAGTAWVLERFADDELKGRFLPRVAAQDYDELFEGAMFLTERAGGSDVGANTVSARQEDGEWRLYGDKWFCSNAGRAKAMLVLARPEGAVAGTRGLGLFLVPHERPDGSANGYRFNRLKDKLGTRSMPSGELVFEGATAYPVGPVDRGFAAMAEMMNLSRLYNAVASVANMRRTLNEGVAYAHARMAFGTAIDRFAMLQAQLIDWTVEQEANLRFTFEAVAKLDAVEAGSASARDAAVLRVLTPMAKYHTARAAVDCASAMAEVFGGNGYIEDWPIARFFRDAQVLPIWEGTTNILVLDVLRSFAKEGSGPALLAELGARLAPAGAPALAPYREALAREAADLETHFAALSSLDDAGRTLHAKAWCDRAIRIFQAVLLWEAASTELALEQGRGVLVLASFMRRHFEPKTWRQQLASASLTPGFEPIVRHAPVAASDALALVRSAATATP